MRILCIDFDGVIHSYDSGWQGVDKIPDPPVDGAVEWLNGLIEDPDWEPVIYSSRSKDPKGVAAMKKYLGDLDVNVDRLKFPTQKPAATLTIDDRAICFTGEFPDLDTIADFQPWHKQPKEHTE